MKGILSFGIKEHIDIPGVKYDPKIGILGLEVSASLARPGFNIKLRSKHKARIGKNHRITKDDAIKFYTEKFEVRDCIMVKIDHMETVELVIHHDSKEKLEEVLDGVKDVVIIQQLFKNMICIYVDVVLER